MEIAREIHLLPASEFEQQIERPLESVEVDRERRLSGRAIGLEILVLDRGFHHPNRLNALIRAQHGGRWQPRQGADRALYTGDSLPIADLSIVLLGGAGRDKTFKSRTTQRVAAAGSAHP